MALVIPTAVNERHKGTVDMDLKSELRGIVKKVPPEVSYSLLLFAATRIMLTVIGLLVHRLDRGAKFTGIQNIVNIYSVWDTHWYVNLAKFGYYLSGPGHYANYAFFPLYSLAMRLVGTFLEGDYRLAGFIISNVCLFITCVYLYKLVMLEDDGDTAKRSVKYLLLFPSAFILSGVFSESIFLMLLVMCFYYARKENWLFAGICGFYLSLTRLQGILVLIPLLYEYWRSNNYKIAFKPKVLYLMLIPFGLAIFSLYNYYLTGDYLAFVHISKVWNNELMNPLEALYMCMTSQYIQAQFGAYFAILAFALLTIFYRKVGGAYYILSVMFIFTSLAAGEGTQFSVLRYLLVVFPLFILLAKLGKNAAFDQVVTISMALLQGFLMVYWTLHSNFII